jgi:hypothetical protein
MSILGSVRSMEGSQKVMDRRFGCPECGRQVLVNMDNKLRAHYPDPARTEARRPGGMCEGSGMDVGPGW